MLGIHTCVTRHRKGLQREPGPRVPSALPGSRLPVPCHLHTRLLAGAPSPARPAPLCKAQATGPWPPQPSLPALSAEPPVLVCVCRLTRPEESAWGDEDEADHNYYNSIPGKEPPPGGLVDSRLALAQPGALGALGQVSPVGPLGAGSARVVLGPPASSAPFPVILMEGPCLPHFLPQIAQMRLAPRPIRGHDSPLQTLG